MRCACGDAHLRGWLRSSLRGALLAGSEGECKAEQEQKRVERGNAAEGKSLIESALQKDSNLKDAHYYLGKAEMQLGNNEGAISHFRQAITGDSNPEIIRQAYYQLAQLYRRMHRTEDAQAALAQFQKLKEEADESQHELLEKKRQRQEQNAADQPVPADNHD